MEELINVMGVNVNIWIGGSGKPLFFFTGWNGTFENNIDMLREISKRGFRVYGIEFPGVGKSDAPLPHWTFDDLIYVIEGIFKNYYVAKAIVLGHSLGSIAAIQFAGRFPERVERLIIVNSPNFTRRNTWAHRKIFNAGFFIFTALLKPAAWTMVAAKGIAKLFLLHRLWRKLSPVNMQFAIDWLHNQYHYLANSNGAVRKVFSVFIESDTAEDARYVHAPTLIVWGEKAGITTPVKNSDILRQNIPDHSFTVIPGAPHNFTGEWASKLVDRVADWSKDA